MKYQKTVLLKHVEGTRVQRYLADNDLQNGDMIVIGSIISMC
jgi:hypothetical protein